MPWAAIAVPAIASLAGAGLNYIGQENAQSNQQKQATDALNFAKQQQAQQQSNYEGQQAASAARWNAYQQQIAPILAARSGMLSYYGLGPKNGSAPMGASTPAPMGASTPGAAAGAGMVTGGGQAAPISVPQIASTPWHPYVGPSAGTAQTPAAPAAAVPSIADLMVQPGEFSPGGGFAVNLPTLPTTGQGQ